MNPACPSEPAKQVAIFKGHAGRVAALAFSPDRSLLVSVGSDGSARVWNVGGKSGVRGTFDRPGTAFRSLAFPCDGRRVAVGSGAIDGLIWIFDVTEQTPRETAVLRGARGAVDALTFSTDGKLISGGGEDRTVRVWEAAPGRIGTVRAVLPGHDAPIMALAFTPDGRSVAAATAVGTVRLWTLGLIRSSERATLPGTTGVDCVAYSPDGGTLAVGCRDGVVRLWDVSGITPALRSELTGHTGGVIRALYTADGTTLVTVAGDGRVVNWDVRSKVKLREWKLARAGSSACALTIDGRYMADAASDGSIEVYRVAEKR